MKTESNEKPSASSNVGAAFSSEISVVIPAKDEQTNIS